MEINEEEIKLSKTRALTRGAFWASAAFYCVIAFEFFYMASPFAAYFYGVYGPGLDFLGESPLASWLVSFFLPHIAAQSTSWFVDWHAAIGGVLTVGGLTGFVIGAIQIYRNKLRKGEAVVGGIYHHIRHPQYAAFIIAAFGMVLIWPRFLVLFGFVTVVFVYILLARTEEQICLKKFTGYAAYRERTGMFFPKIVERPFTFLRWPTNRIGRLVSWVGLYVASVLVALSIGAALKIHAVNSLYTAVTSKSVYLSVGEMGKKDILKLAEMARTSPEVNAALEKAERDENSRFLNYILPSELYISEIPLHLPEGVVTTHRFPKYHNQSRYKIIYTKVQTGPGRAPAGLDIMHDAINKEVIVEAWINRVEARVTHVYSPPIKSFYGGMAVPVY